MRYIFFILTLFACSMSEAQTLNLVPWPQEVKQHAGSYAVKNTISVSTTFPAHDWKPLFTYFRDEMKKNFNVVVKEVPTTQKADINFEMRRMPTSGKAAYQLKVDQKGVVIAANFDVAAFYGMQTFFQLLPLDAGAKKVIPFVEISDRSRFEYRGMHLDVCRHFFPVSFIKKYIDYLAYHKFNRFHWHLTEDQGWRIEIKKYPLLTSVGGWRNGTIIGRYPGKGSDNTRYGGYYTQAQVKEVVDYARSRYIDVIPEIEMPGHASAAIAAYPFLSCFPERPTAIPANMISSKSVDEQKNGRVKLVQETWGVFDDVFCAGKDSTFAFLQNVIDEVIPLFPSKYFHIGGDECPKTHWKQCPHCQQRMKELGLKDEHELQSYFVQRMEKYLNGKGKTLIGWDEILEGGLAPNAVVMSWRGEEGGITAAKQKHQVIMTPGNPVYFDYTQSQQEDSVTIGGYNPLENVYAYEPIPKELNSEEAGFILGAQANLWTEYIKNPRKVEYMIFPRMSALSEVLWTMKENKNWKSFEERLPGQIKRYKKWNANYSTAYYDLAAKATPGNASGEILWSLSTKLKPAHVQYRLDTTRGNDYFNYDKPVVIQKSTLLESKLFDGEHKQIGKSIFQEFHFNKATGKAISLEIPATKKYPGDGAFTLVNGIQNIKGMARTTEFLGFEGEDCIAIIDLGKETEVNQVVIHHLEQQGSWIYSPAAVDIARSDDGVQFVAPGPAVSLTKSADKDKTTVQFASPFKTRFLKIKIFNFGIIPQGKPGADHKAWLFVDEIEVN